MTPKAATAAERQLELVPTTGRPGAGFLAGLIGAGIGPSLSPSLHEQEAAALGLRYVYRLIDIETAAPTAADVSALISSARVFGFTGLNVTHPCKRAAARVLDALSPVAAELGAVNTVVFADGHAIGHNTDWSGFAKNLRRGLPGAALGHVIVLGAGGAGAAAGYALARLGAEKLTVTDAEESRAVTLAATLGQISGRCRIDFAPLKMLATVLDEADCLVHATPTGMVDHPGTAIPATALQPGLWVADVIYRPLHTELLRAAHEAGCRTLGCGGMAVFQAAETLRLFTGVEPDIERMLANFQQLTAQEARHAPAE